MIVHSAKLAKLHIHKLSSFPRWAFYKLQIFRRKNNRIKHAEKVTYFFQRNSVYGYAFFFVFFNMHIYFFGSIFFVYINSYMGFFFFKAYKFFFKLGSVASPCCTQINRFKKICFSLGIPFFSRTSASFIFLKSAICKVLTYIRFLRLL